MTVDGRMLMLSRLLGLDPVGAWQLAGFAPHVAPLPSPPSGPSGSGPGGDPGTTGGRDPAGGTGLGGTGNVGPSPSDGQFFQGLLHPGRWLGSGADWRNTWSDWGFGGPSNAALRAHLHDVDQGPARDAARRQQLYEMFKRGARRGELTFEDVVYGPRPDKTTASGMAPGGHYLMAMLGDKRIYDAPFGTPGTDPMRYFSEKKIERLRRIENRKGGAR